MRWLSTFSIVFAAMLATPSLLGDSTIQTSLNGYEETPQAISTPASGEFKAKIDRDNSIEYELSYTGLETNVIMAHIHFGRPGISGGIAAWLCQTAPNLSPVATTPFCAGTQSGTVTGIITAGDVVGPAGQGISAGQFDELIAAIKADTAYVNVHTVGRPGGEIRGHIK